MISTNVLSKCFSDMSDLFADPVNGEELNFQGSKFVGIQGNSYNVEDNIADFYVTDGVYGEQVSDSSASPAQISTLSNYASISSRSQFREEMSKDIFFNFLDSQLPRGVAVLDAGCGSGQLSNYLAMSPWRRVIGADLELDSLIEAENFRCRFEINNSAFLRMNVFNMPFKPASFDVVIASAFLHKTGNAKLAFDKLIEKLKVGGLIIVGLYSRYAKLSSLMHTNNSTFTQDEVLTWFDSEGIEFLTGSPSLDGSVFDSQCDLSQVHSRANSFRRALSQLTMLIEHPSNGLFFMVGRKTH